MIAIMSMSVITLYSAGQGSFEPWASKQLLRIGIGWIICLLTASINIRWWSDKAYTIYLINLFLLVAVEILGVVSKGAQRWIDLYFIKIQPSELMRVSVVLLLARYFHHLELRMIKKNKYLLAPIILVLIPVVLVLRQPDLDTAFLLILTTASVFFFVGVQWWKFSIVLAAAIGSLPFIWNMMQPYQQRRILTFLNPEADPNRSGYHLMQSKIALGSGGIAGKGLLQGTQSQLNFLPEKQTDFIFSMFGEEFGFIGGAILIIALSVVIFYCWLVAMSVRWGFSKILVMGLTTTLFLYVFINIAMVMGVVPVVGIPLPFFSFGGTAMLAIMFSIGLIFSAELYTDRRL
jgi:rod shape determining protein RodA